MNRPHLFGFTGPAGAGKDTCAQLLEGHGFRSRAFADLLRAEVAEAWRVDLGLFTERATKEWPVAALAVDRCTDAAFITLQARLGRDLAEPRSPRWVLQQWGTDFRRSQNSLYWLDAIAVWVDAERAAGHRRLCITDVRFPNEAQLLVERGGLIVRVYRPDLPAHAALRHDTSTHASEQTLPCAHTVWNHGTVSTLHVELVRLLERLDGAPIAAAAA